MAFVTIKDKNNVPLGYLQADANERLGVHNFMHVQDQKAAGSSGGTLTSGAWRTRTLNTVLINSIFGASLSSNRITLPPGGYYVDGVCIGYGVGSHTSRIFDVNNSQVLCSGLSAYTHPSYYVENITTVCCFLSLTSGVSLELQHKSQSTNSIGMGAGDSNLGQLYSVFADLKIWKIA